MSQYNTTVSKGFLMAGFANFSVLLFSRFFTNETIAAFDPVVLSNFGVLMIVIWGLAYISVAKSYPYVKWLVAVFAVEKLIYGVVWINWQMNNSLGEVFAQDTMAGIFYSIYGVNDWLFCIFFAWVFVQLNKKKA